MSRTAAVAIVLFPTLLGLWTWRLLVPDPVPRAVGDELSADWLFLASKAAHLGAYAALTVLAAGLPVGRTGFRMVVACLALHGVATEIGQTLVPNRVGSVRDVLIDWVGIGLGLLVVRRVSRRPAAAPPTPRG